MTEADKKHLLYLSRCIDARALKPIRRQRNLYRALAIILSACCVYLMVLNRCAAAPEAAQTAEATPVQASQRTLPSPQTLREFCADTIAQQGHAETAWEIAGAIVDHGVPQLTEWLTGDEAACLLLAVMDVESSFRIHARGCAHEIGLMQWKAEYYGKYAPDRDYHKPSTNVYVGALVLSHRLSSSDGDLALAVARYNSPAARRCNGYARRVMRQYNLYRALWRDWEPPEHMRVL